MDIANYDIEKLIGNFTQEAENAQNLLSNLLKGVTNGQPPTLDEISELGSVLKNLHAKYQNVRSVASSILDTTELPEAGCPVKEYLEAIQKSQRQQLKTKLEEVGGLINRFPITCLDSWGHLCAFSRFHLLMRWILSHAHCTIWGSRLGMLTFKRF